MVWRNVTKDEQATYCSNVKLTPGESLIYFVKTREVRKVKGYDNADMQFFDKFDWDAADKIGVKIPAPVRESRPQWTIVAVKPDGTYGGYQINHWDMVWYSQKSAEKIIEEMEDPTQPWYRAKPYKLKAVLWTEKWTTV